MAVIPSVVSDRLSSFFLKIREKILGVNNENLDFLIDTFYKLTPSQRNGVTAGGVAAIALFVICSIALYFMQVNSLQTELDKSLHAISSFRALRLEDQEVSEKFDGLVDSINRKNKGFYFKPFFEKLSKKINVEFTGISERDAPADPTDPLPKKVKVTNVDMKLPKISIPKLLTFVMEIEKSNHFLRVQDMKITGQYGNKLYFDVQLTIRGYVPST
jgi:hypothetical protein